MKIVNGNVFSSRDDVILVTSNSYVKKNGELVMGKGAALELARKFPWIAKSFGDAVYNITGTTNCGKYGVIWDLTTHPTYGIFQTKYHYKNPSDIDLIRYSAEELLYHLEGVLKGNTVSINFPGVGCGGLTVQDVLPVVSILPDSVSLYILG